MLSAGLCAQVACVWEASARKPGNVHRSCDFDDATYLDFLLSAAALAPVLDTAVGCPVGLTVLHAVQATRAVVPSNTNLGIVLLLAPLAAVPPEVDLHTGIERILQGLTLADASRVYEAIRLARPGGLGEVPEQDVRHEPTQSLREIMALAADRDLIARQYADGFRAVFDEGEPALRTGLQRAGSLEGAIIFCHLHLLATFPDSLICRKRGEAEAEEAARRAGRVLDAGWPTSAAAGQALAAFDAWLRAEGHQRNPGTTADLVTASLFVALRTATIQLPLQLPWTTGADHG
jgi:triphosphoribosyl-dephospho-CoA synthase